MTASGIPLHRDALRFAGGLALNGLYGIFAAENTDELQILEQKR